MVRIWSHRSRTYSNRRHYSHTSYANRSDKNHCWLAYQTDMDMEKMSAERDSLFCLYQQSYNKCRRNSPDRSDRTPLIHYGSDARMDNLRHQAMDMVNK